MHIIIRVRYLDRFRFKYGLTEPYMILSFLINFLTHSLWLKKKHKENSKKWYDGWLNNRTVNVSRLEGFTFLKRQKSTQILIFIILIFCQNRPRVYRIQLKIVKIKSMPFVLRISKTVRHACFWVSWERQRLFRRESFFDFCEFSKSKH